MGDSEERRWGNEKLAGDIGYIKGSVKGINEKIDSFVHAVEAKHDEQDAKILANANQAAKTAKKVDRFIWTGTGISGAFAGLYGVLIVKGEALRRFLHGLWGS